MSRLWNPPNLRALLILNLSLFLVGCQNQVIRTTVPADRLKDLTITRTEPLKAHLRNGHMVVFEPWTIDDLDRTVRGPAKEYDHNRLLIATADSSYPIDSVVLFESNTQELPGSVTALTVLTIASVITTVYCIMNPKACFGSCPTVYTESNGQLHLDAEAFSSSVLPSLKAVDIDYLRHATPNDGKLRLTLTNEALETHVIDRMDVLEFKRKDGERVLRSGNSDFFYVSNIAAPSLVKAGGRPTHGLLAADDGEEYFTTTDSFDLAKEEMIELTFDDAHARPALMLRMRQSLVSTYVFYQALAYLGSQAASTFAKMDGGVASELKNKENIGDLLAQLRIEIQRKDGSWMTHYKLEEHGPIASDEHLIPLPPGTKNVRLKCAQGSLRFDHVAMCSVESEARPKRIRPSMVRTNGFEAPDRLEELLEPKRSLITYAGDKHQLIYDVSSDPCEYFLESEGYYLEWMREEWMKEENAMLAAETLIEPRKALKRMAPGYKEMEPYMERDFWSSRFARP